MVTGTVRAVAAQFNLTKTTVARHRKMCLAPMILAAARTVAPSPEPRREVERANAIVSGEVLPTYGDVLALTALMERVARSLERLDTAAQKSVTDGQPMALAALSGQLHRGIEMAAKLTGAVGSEPEKPSFGVTIIVPERRPGVSLPLETPPCQGAEVLSDSDELRAIVDRDGIVELNTVGHVMLNIPVQRKWGSPGEGS